MSLLTDAEILHHADTQVGEPTPKYPICSEDWINFGRAIEAATAAKYAERIAELERLHKQACDMYMMKNRSGCVCKIDPDTDELLSPCGLHDEWLSEKTADLQAKLDAAAVDAERLNHIEQNARRDPKMDGQHVWWPTSFNRALKGPTLRDAIDAAMRTGEPKP